MVRSNGVDMSVLRVVWWIGAVGGLAAVVVAALDASARRRWLWAAAAGWLVAGVLGLGSIGVFFLVAAVACAIAAARARPTAEGEWTSPGATG